MPKNLPLKQLTEGPVAARTRLKLGSPVYKSPPVQYPDSWPLLHKAIVFSKLPPSRELSSAHSPTIYVGEDEEKVAVREDTKRRQFKRQCMRKLLAPLLPELRIEPCKRRVRQKAKAGKKLRGSYVDLVTFKSASKKRKSLNRKVKSSKKGRTKISRNTQRHAKSRSRNTRRKTKTRRQGGKGRTKRRTARRRRASRKRKKKPRNSRKKRTRRHRDGSTDRGRTLEAEAPIGHACDYMLKQQHNVATDAFESVHDEIKDDPLNISNICRTLVKNLPGAPADCREETFDERNTKPEHLSQMKVPRETRDDNSNHEIGEVREEDDTHKTEVDRFRPTSKSKHSSKKGNCAKELRALLKDRNCGAFGKCQNKATARLESRRMEEPIKTRRGSYIECALPQKPSIDTEKRMKNVSDVENTSSENDEEREADQEQKNAEENNGGTSATDAVSKQELADTQQEVVNEDKKVLSGRVDYTLPLSKYNKDQTEHKRVRPERNKISNRKNVKKRSSTFSREKPTVKNSKTIRLNAKTLRPLSTARNNEHETGGRASLRHKPRKKVDSVPIPQPYPGKPAPRNRRREDIDIIKKQGKNISLFVKKVRCNRSFKAKRTPAPRKRNAVKHERRRRRASSKRRKATATRRARGSKTSERRRTRRRASNETNNNSNNINNNQTESGAWGRVSGRLLRIGRYLLRKFQLFLW